MIKREISIFLVVGLLTVLVDFCSYYLFLWTDLIEVAPAKTIGFVTGTVFAYFANKLWTFRHAQSGGNLLRFGMLYGGTLALNVSINALVISLVGQSRLGFAVAFFLATASSAILNFIGMKFFVFLRSNK